MFAQTKGDTPGVLNKMERSIMLISSFAAKGDMPKLHNSLNAGLDAGLTVSEIKEMLVQLYAYAGFPRSLNALDKFMVVLDERKARGLKDLEGKEPARYAVKKTMLQAGTENQTKLVGSPVAGAVYKFAPAIDQFLKEHLFGAIFSRDNLDWKTRELVTISALAAIEGVEPQLRSHFGVGMHNGLTAGQLFDLSTLIATEVDQQRGIIARQVLQSVIDKKPYESMNTQDVIFPIGEKISNDNFVGNAWLNQLIQSDSSNKTQVGNVTFEPGARTKWHYHPAGQILLALDGLGYYQEKGSPKRLLRKGDVVKCPANVWHWHGASPGEGFVQIAITNSQNGPTVWLGAVSEAEYNGPF
jgi:quercetin dioxygenase-like cupin family protein/alkylhydroperoxidase/carboxymuconolactone decarboxylase family protein YurZ